MTQLSIASFPCFTASFCWLIRACLLVSVVVLREPNRHVLSVIVFSVFGSVIREGHLVVMVTTFRHYRPELLHVAMTKTSEQLVIKVQGFPILEQEV
jgi:hypothetical protein